MAAESGPIETWVYQLLSSSLRLQQLVGAEVYHDPAPAFPTLPAVVFEIQAPGQYTSSLDGTPGTLSVACEIRAVAQKSSEESLQPIADEFDRLLVGAVDDVAWGRIRCVKLGLIDRRDVIVGATRYAHLGGVYQIRYSPTT